MGTQCWSALHVNGESRPLRRTSSGRRFDAIDVANHLAAWLEPKLLAVDVAAMAEELVNRIARDCTPSQRVRLSAAAKRWLVEPSDALSRGTEPDVTADEA